MTLGFEVPDAEFERHVRARSVYCLVGETIGLTGFPAGPIGFPIGITGFFMAPTGFVNGGVGLVGETDGERQFLMFVVEKVN